MKSTQIREIRYHSKDYQTSLLLRDAVLRVPLGLHLFDEDLSKEKDDQHIGAFVGSQLVGIMIMTKVNDDILKMRQLAVAETYRDKGIGRKLISHAETYAKENGYKEIDLHARKVVVDFYEHLGYVVEGEPFVEVGIPHNKMFKSID